MAYNVRMATVNVEIPDELNARLQEVCRRRACSAQQAIEDVVRRWLAVEQFRQDAHEVRALARAAGYQTDEDILEDDA